MRPIDADAVLDRYYAEYEKQDICDGDQDRDWLKQCLDEAPTIDAVPVVRCKYCKHWEDGWLGYCTKCHVAMAYDSFCSYGERRDEYEDY